MHIPAILKILIVFGGMLILSRVRIPLAAALVAGGLALGLWAGCPPSAVAADLGQALTRAELWLFILITAMIVEFGRFTTEKRNADAIVAAIRRWGGRHGRACSLMAVPSVIGLIPMPAGALFSAPFVEQSAGGAEWASHWKTAVNYWFRHTWEYWWPLYPGIIVAMSVFRMETWQFICAQILYTPTALAVGYLCLIRPHLGQLALAPEAPQAGGRSPFRVLLPLALVVLSAVFLPFFLGDALPGLAPQIRRMLAMLIGMGIGLAVIVADERKQGRIRVFSSVFRRRSLNVLATVGGVLIFKSMLDASGLLPDASRDLLRWGAPVAIAVAGLPFLAGFVTGLAIGFTGVSFPLVVGLMDTGAGGLTPMATLVLAFGFGYAGMMLSPIHLCLVVTREYFSSPLARVYRHLAPCVGAILGLSLLLHLLFRALGL